MRRRTAWVLILTAAGVVMLAAANLLLGSARIPAAEVWQALGEGSDASATPQAFIVWQSRIPLCVTALVSGAALSVSGLMLQTTLSNPLADPSILGISSGAGLGAAVVTLTTGIGGGGLFHAADFTAITAGAFAGALAVTAVVLALSAVVRSNALLLIAGIMIGYVASSVISLMSYFSTAEGIRSYVVWGMGSFGGVSLNRLGAFAGVTAAGLLMSALLIKPLNALLLGEHYATNLGVNVRRTRIFILIITSLLTAIVTAFCGPISFIGIAVPHVARLLLRTSDHKSLLPATMLGGSAVALLCNLICMMPGHSGLLPLNAVTPIICAPVVIYVILRQRRNAY